MDFLLDALEEVAGQVFGSVAVFEVSGEMVWRTTTGSKTRRPLGPSISCTM